MAPGTPLVDSGLRLFHRIGEGTSLFSISYEYTYVIILSILDLRTDDIHCILLFLSMYPFLPSLMVSSLVKESRKELSEMVLVICVSCKLDMIDPLSN